MAKEFEQLVPGDWIFDLNEQEFRKADEYDLNNFYERSGSTLNAEPVELTAELMDRNGWSYHSGIRGYFMPDYIEKERLNEFVVIINYSSTSNSETSVIPGCWRIDDSVVVFVTYVHQLQQLLRLIGLADKANSFKV